MRKAYIKPTAEIINIHFESIMASSPSDVNNPNGLEIFDNKDYNGPFKNIHRGWSSESWSGSDEY